MLDAETLKIMKKHLIFATGEIVDGPEGVNMMNSGRMLRWVACTGEIGDWAIYCLYADEADEDKVWNWGDKIFGQENVDRCVPCTNEAFKMYRP